MRILPIAFLAATATVAGNANADTMYKCTDPNGKVSYSDQPCSGKSKAATLTVVAPQHKADDEDYRDSPRRGGPQETESERLKRAEADFQDRRRRREEAEDAEAAAYSSESRRARQLAERLQPKTDPKQTTLSAPTWRQQAREAKKREEEEKRRRDALLPSIH